MNKHIMGIAISLHDDGPAVGWTDFVRVHVLRRAQNEVTLLRHEAAHVLLRHGSRIKAMRKKWPEATPMQINAATDAEIALCIYDDEDEAAIAAPRSPLAGGITRHTVEKWDWWIDGGQPDGAEEILELMLQQPDEMPLADNFDDHMMADADDADDNADDCPDPETLRQAAAEAADDDRNERRQQQMQDQAAKSVKRHTPAPLSGRQQLVRALENIASHCYFSARRAKRWTAAGAPRKRLRHIPAAPRVSIYVDRSGSFTPAKTDAAEQAVKKLAMTKGLKAKPYYFSDSVFTGTVGAGGGTNYAAVMRDINDTMPELAIVITDDDMCGDVLPAPVASQLFVVPIGCDATQFAKRVKTAIEVRL